MKHVDLFSGIGGFALACQWAGIETVAFCECNAFCQKVLRKHWPDVPIVEDVRNVEEIKRLVADAEGTRTTTEIDKRGTPKQDNRDEVRNRDSTNDRTGLLFTAGFPCQPFSTTRRRRGSADDHYLWPETLAVIEAVRPDWVLLENVAGILSMVFPDSESGVASQASLFRAENDEIADYDTICGRIERDLRQAGYETVWLVIPACTVNAPHRRNRVWVVAYDEDKRCQWTSGRRWDSKGPTIAEYRQDASQPPGRRLQEQAIRRMDNKPEQSDSDVANSEGTRLEGAIAEREVCRGGLSAEHSAIPGWEEDWYEVATRFCRVYDGVPHRVDRLRSLGNAIVPQVAYQIIRAIVECDSVALDGG